VLFGQPNEIGAGRFELAQLAKEIAMTGRDGSTAQLQVSAPDLPIPWGVIYDSRAYAAAVADRGRDASERFGRLPTEAAAVDPLSFWGWRFNITRLVPSIVGYPSGMLGGGEAPRVQAVLNPALAEYLEHQRQMFATKPDLPLDAAPPIEGPDAFLEWVRAGAAVPCDLLYFFCHAGAPREYSERGYREPAQWMWDAYVGLSGDETDASGRVTLDQVRQEWGKARERQPLVFLNACGSAQHDRVYGSPFIHHFFALWQVRTFVGTDWAAPATFADEFSRRVVSAFVTGGATIASALHQASAQGFAERNPYPLMYSLFGRNDVHLPDTFLHV
jgi:hypothetical protein